MSGLETRAANSKDAIMKNVDVQGELHLCCLPFLYEFPVLM